MSCFVRSLNTGLTVYLNTQNVYLVTQNNFMLRDMSKKFSGMANNVDPDQTAPIGEPIHPEAV